MLSAIFVFAPALLEAVAHTDTDAAEPPAGELNGDEQDIGLSSLGFLHQQRQRRELQQQQRRQQQQMERTKASSDRSQGPSPRGADDVDRARLSQDQRYMPPLVQVPIVYFAHEADTGLEVAATDAAEPAQISGDGIAEAQEQDIPVPSPEELAQVTDSEDAVASQEQEPGSSLASSHNQWLQRAKMYQSMQANFADRPSSEEWPFLLATSVQKGRTAACASDVPLTANKWGFGSKINNLVNVLWVAVYLGASVSWRLPDPFLQPWSEHFDNKIGLSVHVCSADPRDWVHYTRLYVDSRMWSEKLTAVDGQYMADLKRFITGQLWTLKAATLSRINDRLAAAGLQEGKPYIGVHIRHGDKGEEAELLPVAEYANSVLAQAAQRSFLQIRANTSAAWDPFTMTSLATRIKHAARRANLDTVYLASDDPSALRGLTVALGDQAPLRVLQAPEAGRQECNLGATGKECPFDEEDSLISLLTDVEALRRSSTFIGTASSNLGRLVYFLRASDQPSVSLDDGGDFMLRGG